MKPRHQRNDTACTCDSIDCSPCGARLDGFEDQPRDEQGRWGEGGAANSNTENLGKAPVSHLYARYSHFAKQQAMALPKDKRPAELTAVLKELKARKLGSITALHAAALAESKGKKDSTMKTVLRLDRGELEKPVRLGNGWLKVDGRLTRTGVFTYRNADGSERRELRLAEDVFKADALASFSMAPVTDEHPPVFLDAANTKDWARGSVSEQVNRDGDTVRAKMLITDADLIGKMERGDAVEVSCGYNCDLEESPGISAAGERYDCIQRNITGNHVAIVQKGRAGRDARVRMDSAAERVVEILPPGPAPTLKTEKSTMKIRIDGIEYDAGSEAAAQAFAKHEAMVAQEKKDHADALAKAATALAASQARADEADEKAKKLDAEVKALPGKVAADLRARMALETRARNVLGAKAKLDGLDDKAVKVAMLKKLRPELDVSAKADAYIDARLDAAEEAAEEEEDPDDESGEGEEKKDRADRSVNTDDEGHRDLNDDSGNDTMSLTEARKDSHEDSETAKVAMNVRLRNEWRLPVSVSAADLKR